MNDRAAPARPDEEVIALALREAITNVVRHSGASRACIRVWRDGTQAMLEVADDGRGIAATEGAGLRGMRERVEAVGGYVNRAIDGGMRSSLWRTAAASRVAMIRVVVAEDQSMVRGRSPRCSRSNATSTSSHKRATAPQALEMVETHRPDVLAHRHRDAAPLRSRGRGADRAPRSARSRVVILTTFARAGYLRRALDAGASGYLLEG